MYRLRYDYDYIVSKNLRLRYDYDYFLNKIHYYDYDYSLFVIDYNRLRLRDYDYSKSALKENYNTTVREERKFTFLKYNFNNAQYNIHF